VRRAESPSTRLARLGAPVAVVLAIANMVIAVAPFDVAHAAWGTAWIAVALGLSAHVRHDRREREYAARFKALDAALGNLPAEIDSELRKLMRDSRLR
jgi:hypothetical protein